MRSVDQIDFRLPALATPLREPVIFIDTARVAPYFNGFRDTRNLLAAARGKDFAAKVAKQVHDIYHSKAGSPSIIEYVPPDIPVVSAFKHLPQAIALNELRGQGGKVHLHIGTPDSADVKYDFLQIPTGLEIREQAKEIRRSLGPGGRDKLRRVLRTAILDGSHPDSIEFLEYAKEIKRIYPKALLNFKISAQSITDDFSGLLYAAKKGLDMSEILKLLQAFPWYSDFGIDLYIGSPLDEARLRKISEFIKHIDAIEITPKAIRKPKISSLYIGGMGGFGDKVPHEQMLDLFAQIWELFPQMEIEVEHGRGAVERMAYALFPDTDIATIASHLPDYRDQPDKLEIESVRINDQTYIMVHNVGYLDTQTNIKVEIV